MLQHKALDHLVEHQKLELVIQKLLRIITISIQVKDV
jgi:hypothetical protein